MVELRVIFLVGLVLTAVLTVLVAVAGAWLVNRLRRAWGAIPTATTPSGGPVQPTSVTSDSAAAWPPDVDRLVRSRHAAWRLRC